jgi:hypothetical protein
MPCSTYETLCGDGKSNYNAMHNWLNGNEHEAIDPDGNSVPYLWQMFGSQDLIDLVVLEGSFRSAKYIVHFYDKAAACLAPDYNCYRVGVYKKKM